MMRNHEKDGGERRARSEACKRSPDLVLAPERFSTTGSRKVTKNARAGEKNPPRLSHRKSLARW